MFHPLVSRNEDIRRLVDKGYAIAFDSSNYLIVRDIPYLDHAGGLKIGAIVTKFVDAGQDLIHQDDHQVFFAGSHPHGLDGQPIPNLGGGTTNLALSESSKDVVVERSFSNKPIPSGKFADFFQKIESYVRIISGPATAKHGATALTFRSVEIGENESPFKIRDTMTSRAEIGDLAVKFRDDSVAIIGLGGTGSYVLDFLAKTQVREIRGFDSDLFHVHNAFRSPGRLDVAAEIGHAKSDVYQSRYDSFRKGLALHRKFIDATSAAELAGVTFAFVCVDKGESRAGIFDLLQSVGIPFIDVGMGLDRKRGALNGMLRSTYFSKEEFQARRDQGLAELVSAPDAEYRTNIQTAELNALNACLAVIQFKQLRGFYLQERADLFHVVFGIENLKVYGNVATAYDRAGSS